MRLSDRAGDSGRLDSSLRFNPKAKSRLWERQEDIVRLYVGDGLTLREIGDKLGVSRQTVCNILKDAGITAAQKAKKPAKRRTVEQDAEIRRLYVDEDIPIQEIAPLLGLPIATVSESLHAQNVSVKRGGMASVRHPKLRRLAVGEWLELPRRGGSERNTYVIYYTMAMKAGIRVSVRVISDDTVRVTRKA